MHTSRQPSRSGAAQPINFDVDVVLFNRHGARTDEEPLGLGQL
jgi:hypothetical protein